MVTVVVTGPEMILGVGIARVLSLTHHKGGIITTPDLHTPTKNAETGFSWSEMTILGSIYTLRGVLGIVMTDSEQGSAQR